MEFDIKTRQDNTIQYNTIQGVHLLLLTSENHTWNANFLDILNGLHEKFSFSKMGALQILLVQSSEICKMVNM
jgi:hypothetical protein